MDGGWQRVLVCCDSFKGTLTACDAGRAIERAIRAAEKRRVDAKGVEVVHCPMSDGGAGLLDSLLFSSSSSSYHFTRVEVPLVEAPTDGASPPIIIGPLGETLNDGSTGKHRRPYFACDLERSVVVVEMSVAAGLPLVPEAQRNPLRTTSYGVGQLIMYAVHYVAEAHSRMHLSNVDCGTTVFLGIGGSATNDGGLGALQALGVDLLVSGESNSSGSGGSSVGEVQPLTVPFTGGDLQRLAGVRLSSTCQQMFFRTPESSMSGKPYCRELRLIGDVTNPLIGSHGATAVFGLQKCNASWSVEQRACVLSQLERGMLHAATSVVRSRPHGRHIGWDEEEEEEVLQEQQLAALLHSPGGGGAGGMGGFFRYLLEAVWTSGADFVGEILELPEKLRQCDCIITGEGSFDEQTIHCNKTVGRLLQMAVLENARRRQTEPKRPPIRDVIVVCGRTSYRDDVVVQQELLAHMRDGAGHCSGDAATVDFPKIHVLPLTPDHFTVDEALANAGVCMEGRLTSFLSTTPLQ